MTTGRQLVEVAGRRARAGRGRPRAARSRRRTGPARSARCSRGGSFVSHLELGRAAGRRWPSAGTSARAGTRDRRRQPGVGGVRRPGRSRSCRRRPTSTRSPLTSSIDAGTAPECSGQPGEVGGDRPARFGSHRCPFATSTPSYRARSPVATSSRTSRRARRAHRLPPGRPRTPKRDVRAAGRIASANALDVRRASGPGSGRPGTSGGIG